MKLNKSFPLFAAVIAAGVLLLALTRSGPSDPRAATSEKKAAAAGTSAIPAQEPKATAAQPNEEKPAEDNGAGGLWVSAPAPMAGTGGTPVFTSLPAEKIRLFTLSPVKMRAQLGKAPLAISAGRPVTLQPDPVFLPLPMPDGTIQRFQIEESSMMEPGLAAKFPEIKTYSGQGVDDPAATVQLDFTTQGFHAQVRSPSQGTWLIDPFFKEPSDVYISHFKSDHARSARGAFVCEDLSPQVQALFSQPVPEYKVTELGTMALTGPTLRTFRLAVSATGEYVAAVGGGTVAGGQSAIVTAINRVNGIYEQELAIRFVLVANNNLLVFTDAATDGFTDNVATTIIVENQTKVDTVIGSANYDIGHVFSTGGGGRSGAIGNVCQTGLKAMCVTGSSNPLGDAFYVDYVAHEMGHQFGGNHTFNGPGGSCSGGSWTSITAHEPGSGSTIMAYAGICAPNNLQPNSDPYFHAVSLLQIRNYVVTGLGTCASQSASGNTGPVAAAGADFTIPARTPFVLTGSGTDANSDALTYSWEEIDLGTQAALTDADNGTSPLFRVYPPTASPSRTFPRLATILSGTPANAEKLPVLARVLNFRLTVRDNRTGGGGVDTDDMKATVVDTGAAFAVTAPAAGATWTGPGTTTVTWNVAGTTGNGINTANVNVLLSTDGGLTFPTTLASNVPNSGSATVNIPAGGTGTARVKVEAVGNVFFAISPGNFNITAPPAVTITSPTHGSSVKVIPTLSGTATAGGTAAIAGNAVNLTLYHVPTGEYWAGTSWSATPATLSVAVNVTTHIWTWTGSVPNAAAGTLRSGRYSLAAGTQDTTGLVSIPQTGVNNIFFDVDTNPPTGSISAPGNGTVIDATGYGFAGFARDGEGMGRVILFIRRNADYLYWNGTTWLADPLQANLASTLDGEIWTSNFTHPVPGAQMPNGIYSFIALIDDAAGNRIQREAQVTVDYHPVFTWTGAGSNDWDEPGNWLRSGSSILSIPEYNAVAGYTTASNTSAQLWQYGYSAANGTGFTNFTNAGAVAGTYSIWNTPAVGDMGILWNASTQTFHYNQGTYQAPDELGMFPNGDGKKCVLRWKAPSSGVYQVNGFFEGIESAGGGTTSDASIVKNGDTANPLLFQPGDASGLNYINGYHVQKPFSFAVSVTAGDTLDFRVGWGSNNNYSYDGTGLQATITPGSPLSAGAFVRVPDADAVAIINGGSPTITAGAQRQVYKLVMTGGVFAQSQLTVLKKFEWTGGQIWGTINVGSQAALEISGANPKYLISYGLYAYGNPHTPGILNNAGTGTWTGTGDIQMQWRTGNGGSLNNSGTFHIQTDADMTNASGGAFVNTGSVDKAASSDVTRLDVVVTNGGTMRADTGRLVFAGGGGVSTGEYQLTSVNCLEWAGGTHTLATGARFTGAGRALISGGTVLGAADTPAGPALVDFAPDAELELAAGGNVDKMLRFTGSGLWRWTGGIVWGILDVTSNMRVAVAGSDPKFLIAYNSYAYGQTDSKGIINHAGTATWGGTGEVQLQWGAKIVNTGSLTVTSDADMTNSGGGSFVNQGLLRKAGSGGDTVFSGVVFSSPGGTLDVQTGVVSLASHGSHSFDTGTQLTGAGRTRIDSATLTASGVIGGTGHIELAPNSALGGTHEFTGATFHWTGGSIIGTTTVGAAGALDISGPEVKFLQGYNLYGYGNTALPGILVNKGTAVWTGAGEVSIQWAQNSGVIEGGTFRNEGTMSIQTDADMTNYSGGRFVNTGTLTKELSSDVTRFDVSCSNNGTVYAKSGKLQINGGGSSSGRFDMQVANSLDFTGGTSVLAHGASFTSQGRARITGGTVAFANTIPNDVTLGAGSGIELATGGALSRDGTFLGSGTFQWTGGTIAGTTNFNGATVFDVSGPDGKVLNAYGIYGYGQADGRGTVNLNSTAVWRGTGVIQCQWGAVLRNNGLLDLQSDAELNEYGGGTFYNAGTLRKSGGAGMSRIANVGLNNTGALDIQTGVLSLVGNHALNPGTSLTGAGRLRTDGGSTTITGVVTGAGHFEHATGVLAGTHTFASATLHWTGGEIDGVTTVGPSAFLDISGPAGKVIQGYNLYGYGNPAAPGILNNQGTAIWTGTGEIQTQWASGIGARFNNSGTFRVQTTALFSSYGGGAFLNSGQLVVGASPGVFNVGTSFIQTATGATNIELAGTNAATPQFDQVNCQGSCTLDGVMNVSAINGFLTSTGDAFKVMSWGSRTGSFAAINTSGVWMAKTYNPNDLTLTSVAAPATLAEWKSYFLPAGGATAADGADPDNDGLTNLVEYATGTDPTVAGLAGLPVPEVTAGNRMSLTFSRRLFNDVTYIVEGSGNLQSWSPVAQLASGASTWTGPGTVSEVTAGGTRTCTVVDTQTLAGARRWLRVRVVNP